jgi:hypothetical protein
MSRGCPCYRAIYSIVPQLPDVVVDVVTEYGHTFADSDVEQMFHEYYCEVGITQHGPMINVVDRNGKSSYEYTHYPWSKWHVLIVPYYCNIPHWVSYIIVGSGHVHDSSIVVDEHIWEHLLDTFGKDDPDGLHRSRTSKIIAVENSKIDQWDEFCDAIINLVYDHLYLRTYSMVCPRLPDPRRPKCTLWPFNHNVNGVQIYRERPSLIECGCNNVDDH